ncbi:MAG: peptidylprolyl isomerase [Pseudomonadota bacterium]
MTIIFVDTLSMPAVPAPSRTARPPRWLQRGGWWLMLAAATCGGPVAAAPTVGAQAPAAAQAPAKPATRPPGRPTRTQPVAAPTPAPPAALPATGGDTVGGDYILVVVNRELITAGEVSRRLAIVTQNAQLNRTPLPPPAELRQQILDSLIDERALITYARENGQKVDDVELERAVANQAQQSQLSLPQFRERLRAEGIDFNTFRNNLRDQLLVERVREREMQTRIKVSNAEIETLLAQKLRDAGVTTEYNVAQVLVKVPEGASDAEVAEKRQRAESALRRLQAGEPMAQVAAELSEDENKDKGGALGMRPADRLPDVFVEQVRNLQPGEVAPNLLRTGAGFHVLQLVGQRSASALPMTQTRARHILLRPSNQLSREAAVRRLGELRQQIQSGRQSFEQLAREYSQDGSGPMGGDLGWTMQGTFVPEFETAMNELPLGGLSEPVVSRFGVHLIQVVDRRKVPVEVRQLRDMARNMLREQKFETAYAEWLQELRAQAYIEFREVPQ